MDSVVREGEVLAGKYRVERILGAGGMGYVVACQHIHLQQKVALKFLRPDMLTNPELVGRFLREAQAAVQIKSEHVARVSDVGTLEDGAPYMVMEYLEGEDLKHSLASRGSLPITEAVDYLLQACEALAEAHVLGIVHRDLKPDNLFVARKADGRACVKVLDFGISKVKMESSGVSNLTGTTAVLGTPYYMAPEQLTSTRNVDVRADIWALGVVLYELISGTLPFLGATFADLCIRIIQDQPVPLPNLKPSVPTALWNVVARCLHKNRDARFSNVAEVAVALASYGTASAHLSTDTISRIFSPQTRGLTTVGTQAPENITGERPALVEVEQTGNVEQAKGVTGQTAWGQTNATTKPSARKARLLIGIASGIAALGIVVWFLRSTGSGSRSVAAAGAMNSAAEPTSSTSPTITNVAAPNSVSRHIDPVPESDAAPLASAHDVSAITSEMRDLSRAAHGTAPIVQSSRNTASKRPSANSAEHGSKANPENLIEDRR